VLPVILRLRRHEPLRPGDRQCPVVRFGTDSVDRCSGRAEPLHDLHSAAGIDPDGEVYGVAWITRAAIPPPPLLAYGPEPDEVSVPDRLPPEVAGAILALGCSTDETTARYWLAVCARRGVEQPLLDQLWQTWADENRPQVIHSDPTCPPHDCEPTYPYRCRRCGAAQPTF
jgi:hypothetical protein